MNHICTLPPKKECNMPMSWSKTQIDPTLKNTDPSLIFLAYREHMVAVLYILQVNKILENRSSMRHIFKKMPCDIDVTFFFGR